MPSTSNAPARLALLAASAFIAFAIPAAVLALDTGLSQTARVAQLPTVSIEQRVAAIVSTALGLVGVIFLILMIYGGFLWMTAGGDAKQTGTAKQIMVNAVIGLALVFGAYALTELAFRTVIANPGPADMTITTEELDADCGEGYRWDPNLRGCFNF